MVKNFDFRFGCLAFSLRFCPKIKQFLSKHLVFTKSCKNQLYKTKQLLSNQAQIKYIYDILRISSNLCELSA